MRSTSQASCTVALRLLGGNGSLLDNDVGRFIADAEAIGQSLTANCVDQDITAVGRNTIRLWAEQYGIGRKLGDVWRISRVALQMFLDGETAALAAYHNGD
jgi:hypothetical protein